MSDSASSPIKRALAEIRTLRAELARATQSAHAPLAIVGMALRLPGGVRDAASFERLLFSGEDPLGDVPSDRWPNEEFFSEDPDAPGKLTTRRGGFLDNVDQFDADFFGISAREAASMDPQQRLLLELAWEATEDAGVSPVALRGARTGVYLALSGYDYGRAIFGRRELIDPYFATGALQAAASGRISYVMGLTGPAVSIDTACSGSLVSLHLACQALRLGECDAALAGGINLILSPEANISFTKGRMMSPDGRCRTFDADADGYVRSEGAVVFLVKRLADAEASGDRILAIVRGSAVNQDGRSSGLTAPNGPAQEAVLRAALANAGVEASEVGYVEAHGTGTPLGDPIELGALAAVFAPGRAADAPLLIGAVKSMLGHTEAAAGAVGVAKCIVGFARGEIAPNHNFKRGTPHIDWDSARLKVVSSPTPLPEEASGRSIAGVSSFGISGTNAHVILERPPVPTPAERRHERPVHVLALSAKSEPALNAAAARWREAISGAADVADICSLANTGRAHFEHRLATVGSGPEIASVAPAHVFRGIVDGVTRPRVGFLFTGQGANFPGMARRLYETSPTFAAALDRCARAAAPHLQRDLVDALITGDPGVLEDTALAQPATFALQVALTELWRSWGVEPVAAVGHSLGEYAAAWAAGVFTLEDAMAAVIARGRAAASIEGQGAMAAVFATKAEVAAVLASHPGVEIAVYNGPEHVVVSGTRERITSLVEDFEKLGRRATLLKIPFASHSALVEPALPALAEALSRVTFSESRMSLASNVSGAVASPREMSSAAYWVAQMRKPVRFADALAALAAQGVTHFVEIGPHPSLSTVGEENFGGAHAWLPSMRRDGEPWIDLLTSLARLYVDGVAIDWAGFDRDYARRRVTGPTYPFQRRRYWIDANHAVDAQADRSAEAIWASTSAAAAAQAGLGPLGLNPASYPAKWALLERLGNALAMAFLRGAGLFAGAERRPLAAILEQAGVTEDNRDLVRRWLDRLVGTGRLRRQGDVYASDGALDADGVDQLLDEAGRTLENDPELLAYIRQCARLLPDVITGRESALQTIFPGGSFDLADGLYQRSVTMRYANAVAAASVTAFAKATPKGRKLRVLEIGAGSGGTTASVLPALPADRTQYLFTDVSEFFFDRARERFAGHCDLSFSRFDLNHDLDAQGYQPGSFDIVISANAVHAATDLRAALARVRALLAPGGLLVLVESTVPFAWFDYTTRLLEGWRAFEDDLRDDEPLMNPETWVDALGAAGFERRGFWPDRASPADTLGQHVILAQTEGEFSGVSAPTESQTARVARAVVETAVAEVAQGILAAPQFERLDLMRDFVRGQVMAVLRRDADDPPGRNSRLSDLGMDSLMAVQLRNRLAQGLSLSKPPAASVMFDHPTIEALAHYLLNVLAPEAPASSEPAPAPAAAVSADDVAAMGDAEIEALLEARMKGRST